MIKQIDALALKLAAHVIRRRWWVIAMVTIMVILAASGARHIEFSNNYRIFFGKDNPELLAFETFQATYTKNDNILIVVQPADKNVFQSRVTQAVEKITAAAWQIPFAIRVDSISNFQHSWADQDDLTVEDLIRNSENLDEKALAEKKAIALAEPLLRNNLISDDAATTGINVTLQYPEKRLEEVPEAVAATRKIVADIQAEYPELTVALTGLTMLNAAFSEAGMMDLKFLVPIMYLFLTGVMLTTLRNISGTIATIFVIGFSSATAIGITGHLGLRLNPVSALAPTIILTLAIADSIHILVTLRKQMRQGLDKTAAIKESIRVNAIPVSITSLTTIVGFLGLNFSDSPPFHDLGNITAMGIAAAWFYSLTFLPAMTSVLPVRIKKARKKNHPGRGMIHWFAGQIIRYRRPILFFSIALTLLSAIAIPHIQLNDEFHKYFDHRVPFRNDAEFAMDNLTGLYVIEYSLRAGDEESISKVDYLSNLASYTQWLRAQPEVVHVYSYSDIIKRLSKNMHGDDPAWYRIPEDRNLAAQYLLLYELSLPFGLDLNDRISIDKSATRITVTLMNVATSDVRAFISRSDNWLHTHTPATMQADATGATVMFSHISERNIKQMFKGNAVALVLIAAVIIISLGSLKVGLLSLIPNTLPILVTFGIWSLTVGQVGMAAATVTSTSLGIIVDDTVHFLAKYLRARRELHMDAADAVKFAFDTVGQAIIITTLILGIGFGVLATSSFQINSQMGMMTAIAIISAFILDFTLLPALLLIGYKQKGDVYEYAKATH